MADALDLTGWTPIRVDDRGEEPLVEWAYTGDAAFTAPFFEETIEACLRRPFTQLFRRSTPIGTLADWAQRRPGLGPSGFVFHMSRCGSTLVSQMLAALPRHLVIAEAPPLWAVLRGRGDERVDRLRWLVSALGQPRAGERHLFVKFDPLSTLELDVVRRAFPDVPWTFVYRDPLEVLASHARMPAAAVMPGAVAAARLGLDDAALAALGAEEHCARVLARICEAALARQDDERRLLASYPELPGLVAPRLLDHFGVRCDEHERDQMLAVALRDAKRPEQPFVADVEAKRREASEALRGLAARFLDPLHERLEAARLSAREAAP